MLRSLPLRKGHPGRSRRTNKSAIVALALTGFLSLALVPDLFNEDSGLQEAEAIAPYLNGVFSAQAPTPGADSATYTITNAFPHLTFIDPVELLELPDGRFMVFGKSGHAWIFDNDPATTTKTLVMNLSSQTRVDGDGGLVGAVLHPEFGQEGSPRSHDFYIWYRYFPPGQGSGEKAFMRLSRLTLNESMTWADVSTEFVMIQQYDQQSWHNGGGMFFGPDGFLYISVGDEGGANDQYNKTQDITKWLFSGVLRIDVDMRGDTISHPIRRQPINGSTPPAGWPGSFTQGYYIPNDNPWLDPNGGLIEEFYAVGTRSPHRMTYDAPTGNIWIGDVGQGSREEISLAPMGSNLQWPYREGNINGPKAKPNPLIGYDQAPVYAYNRSFGQCVIGGFVVRGDKYPELDGKYIFGDHETQQVWTLELGEMGNAQNLEFLLHVPTEGVGSKDGISSFARVSDGTVYILDLYGTNQDGGKIHRLVRNQHGVPPPPQWLSQLGVFTDMNTLATTAGIIPYEVNSPLWSDRSLKRRWIAVPNDGEFDSPGEKVGFDPDDFWTFPEGTVMIKHFDLPLDETDPTSIGRLETRFLVIGEGGLAYGLTYRWNATGTDAYLMNEEEEGEWLVTRSDASVYTQTWSFPSRQQCMNCHNANAGHVLGLKAHQLNGEMLYPQTGITANQLVTWEHLGMFDQPLPPVDELRRARPLHDLTASAEDRVMAYIDANCAHCHRPNGAEGAFDARFSTPLAQKGLVNEPTVGMNSPAGQLVVLFGDTLGSEIWVRDSKPNGVYGSMPPLAKNVVDPHYMPVLTEWIMSGDDELFALDYTALYVKVFLEGPYSDGLMADALRSADLVPTTDPYTAMGMHVDGGGLVNAYPHTLDNTVDRRVVDWVLVELRDATDPTVVVRTMGGLVLNDGTVIDPQGGPLRIPGTDASYHVAVRHRNHLGVMGQTALLFHGGTAVLDLTDSTTATYGTGARKHLGDGVMALWSGDANSDGMVRYTGAGNDRDPVLSTVGGLVPTGSITGYFAQDINLDGVVKYTGPGNDRDKILQNVGGTVPTNSRHQQVP